MKSIVAVTSTSIRLGSGGGSYTDGYECWDGTVNDSP
jgi:hypothetical protein